MEWEIGNRANLLLLLAAVLALGLALYAHLCRRAAAKRFATAESLEGLGWRAGCWRLRFAPWLSAGGLALLALALADIRYGKSWREVPQKGIEVMFLLDVSRSMLAEDVAPNRLTRAKQQIRDLIDEMVGDRIGLVVFAGDAKQVVPLTSHYDDFVQTLDTVNPVSVLRGGSKLGEAIRVGSEGFMEKTNDHKAMVIFTDGEDQESDPLGAARTAFEEQGIRIFAIGLGDLEQGARIPAGEQRSEPTPIYVQHEGQTVWSKLNGQILSEIATSTGGAYIPAGTKRVDMQGVYQGYIASVEQTEFQTARINAFTPRFQWFALPALLCFVAEFLLTNRVRKSVRAAMILCCGCWLGGCTSPAYAQAPNTAPEPSPPSQNSLPAAGQVVANPAGQINAANELLRQEKVTEAIAAYDAVNPPKPLRPTWLYNQGVAHYRQRNYALAAEAFRESASSADRQLAAQSRYNLGNSLYAQALAAIEAAEKATAEKLLSDAIEHYRGALRGDRELVDARANIELAARLLQELNDEQSDQEQQEQQQQEEQREQEQESSSDQQDQQSQAGDESSPAEDERSQSNDDGSQSENDGSQSKDAAEQSGSQQPSSEQGNQAEEQADNAAGNQAGGEEGDDAEETTPAAGQAGEASQPPSTDGELSAANADASSADPSDDPQGKPVTGMMTREEALKMLQSVRDRDLLRRLLKEQRERARRVPVQRDW